MIDKRDFVDDAEADIGLQPGTNKRRTIQSRRIASLMQSRDGVLEILEASEADDISAVDIFQDTE